MTTFRVGSASDVGQVRSNNQDSKLVSDGVGVYAVADGMGGHQGGEVASAIAVETLEAIITDPTTPSVVEAVKEANRRIFSRAADSDELRGMGTTLVAIALVNQGTDEEEVVWVNVGDSRAYLLRDEVFHQLSRDHSLVEDLRRGGQLSDEEAAVHPQRNILTRALGIDHDVEVDTGAVVPLKGDRFLLCSDGLFNEVDRATLTAVLSEGDDPDAIASELVRLANASGGRDNITCVVADVVDDGGRAERAAAAEAVAAEAPTAPDDADPAPTREMPAVAVTDADDEEDATLISETSAAPPPGAPPIGAGSGPPPPPPVAEDTAAAPGEGPVAAPPDPGLSGGAGAEDRTSDDDLPFGRTTTDLYEDLDEAGGRHRVVTVVVALLVLAGVAGIAFFGLSWYANRTVFLGTSGDEVVVYRGTPGGFLIFDPSIEERTEVALDELEDDVAADVEAEREFDSVDDALSRVNSGRTRKPDDPEDEATTTSTTTTTEADSPTTGSDKPGSGSTPTTGP